MPFDVVLVVWGTTIGLALAHWFAVSQDRTTIALGVSIRSPRLTTWGAVAVASAS